MSARTVQELREITHDAIGYVLDCDDSTPPARAREYVFAALASLHDRLTRLEDSQPPATPTPSETNPGAPPARSGDSE